MPRFGNYQQQTEFTGQEVVVLRKQVGETSHATLDALASFLVAAGANPMELTSPDSLNTYQLTVDDTGIHINHVAAVDVDLGYDADGDITSTVSADGDINSTLAAVGELNVSLHGTDQTNVSVRAGSSQPAGPLLVVRDAANNVVFGIAADGAITGALADALGAYMASTPWAGNAGFGDSTSWLDLGGESGPGKRTVAFGADPDSTVYFFAGTEYNDSLAEGEATLEMLAGSAQTTLRLSHDNSATDNVELDVEGGEIWANVIASEKVQLYVNAGSAQSGLDIVTVYDASNNLVFAIADDGAPVLRSPNGDLWRLLVDNSGNLSTEAVV